MKNPYERNYCPQDERKSLFWYFVGAMIAVGFMTGLIVISYTLQFLLTP